MSATTLDGINCFLHLLSNQEFSEQIQDKLIISTFWSTNIFFSIFIILIWRYSQNFRYHSSGIPMKHPDLHLVWTYVVTAGSRLTIHIYMQKLSLFIKKIWHLGRCNQIAWHLSLWRVKTNKKLQNYIISQLRRTIILLLHKTNRYSVNQFRANCDLWSNLSCVSY